MSAVIFWGTCVVYLLHIVFFKQGFFKKLPQHVQKSCCTSLRDKNGKHAFLVGVPVQVVEMGKKGQAPS